MKYITCIILSMFPFSFSMAKEQIDCLFEQFHQVNHEQPELSGYSSINQSMKIEGLVTSKETLRLTGSKRATNSTRWVVLKRDDGETFTTTYGGDFGELLTIGHDLGENIKGLNGWYKASLLESRISVTHTRIGKCLIRT